MRLTRKILTDDTACKDIITELDELQILLKPQIALGIQLYQFDSRQIMTGTYRDRDEGVEFDGERGQRVKVKAW